MKREAGLARVAPVDTQPSWGNSRGFKAKEGAMKKASEYREHAEECRMLANQMEQGDHRDQLLEMAATWDRLALERSELVRRHPELAMEGEHAESGAPPRPRPLASRNTSLPPHCARKNPAPGPGAGKCDSA